MSRGDPTQTSASVTIRADNDRSTEFRSTHDACDIEKGHPPAQKAESNVAQSFHSEVIACGLDRTNPAFRPTLTKDCRTVALKDFGRASNSCFFPSSQQRRSTFVPSLVINFLRSLVLRPTLAALQGEVSHSLSPSAITFCHSLPEPPQSWRHSDWRLPCLAPFWRFSWRPRPTRSRRGPTPRTRLGGRLCGLLASHQE